MVGIHVFLKNICFFRKTYVKNKYLPKYIFSLCIFLPPATVWFAKQAKHVKFKLCIKVLFLYGRESHTVKALLRVINIHRSQTRPNFSSFPFSCCCLSLSLVIIVFVLSCLLYCFLACIVSAESSQFIRPKNCTTTECFGTVIVTNLIA